MFSKRKLTYMYIYLKAKKVLSMYNLVKVENKFFEWKIRYGLL